LQLYAIAGTTTIARAQDIHGCSDSIPNHQPSATQQATRFKLVISKTIDYTSSLPSLQNRNHIDQHITTESVCESYAQY
jgi:hypothetical protein